MPSLTSRTGRLLRRLVRLSCRRPGLTLLAAVALALASVLYALVTLTFATSTRALLPRNQPYIERYVQYDREFGELDDLAIVVEAPSLTEAIVYAGRLVREMHADRVPLSRLAYRIDPKQFEGRALLYMGQDRLSEIRDRIFDYQDFMESFAARPTLDQLVEGVATQLANAFIGGFLDLGLSDSKGALDLKFVHDLVNQISTRLDHPAPYRSPWGSLFAVGGDSEGAGYFLSDDQRLLFILAEPAEEANSFTSNRTAIEGVRATVARLKREFPEVNVGVTGKPALSNDEMTAAFGDSQRATYLAFALTLGLLLAAFLRVGKPLLMLVVLVLSLCWSIGAATLVVGHLSLFSVMFISIVVGIGIDYGIYFLFRYEEEIFLGRSLREAIEITAARAGPGLLLGAVTAAATFYVLILTDFRGVQELGFISGTAILLAWLSMMTVFPATLVLVDRRHADRPRGTMPRAIRLESIHVPFVDRITSHPRTVLAIAAVLTFASLFAVPSVRFDYNLLNLQAEGTESVTWEKKILKTSGRSGFAAMSSADTLDELRRKQQAFRKLKTVSEVDSALLLIPDQQAEKQKIIADFAPIVAPVRVNRPIRLDLERLIGALETLKRRFDVAGGEAPAGDTKRELIRVAEEIGRL
ncbi:MAG TPA: MMPL family transporter, partial [Methylomirabilota bacterium]|nr:MMPL family transporter [Methylomirabilota bacterium]